MNPYLLETEMRCRQTELRQELERSRRLAGRLTGLLRTRRLDRRRGTARQDLGAVQPRRA